MPSLIWAILAVLLFIVQFSTGVFDLLFLGIAALLVATAAALIPGFSGMIGLQVVLFVVGSFGTLALFRKRFRTLFRGEEIKIEADEHAGKTAHVTEEISPGREGRISFQGTTWTAMSHDETIPVGTEVYILEKAESVFYVTSHLLDDPANSPPNLPRS